MRVEDITIQEDFELPSKGKIYEEGMVDSRIHLRSMTVRDEMKRMSPSSLAMKKMCDLIDGCIINKQKLSTYDMAIGDYEFLLHRLRVITYGPEYKMVVRCPYCNELSNMKTDLDELEVIEYNEEEVEKYSNLKLPKSGDTISIKFLTPRMIDDISIKVKEYKKKNKLQDIDPTPMIELTMMIDTVNGDKLSLFNLEEYVNKLPAADLKYIQSMAEKLNKCLGLDTAIVAKCNNCGQDVYTFFREGPEFFGPTYD